MRKSVKKFFVTGTDTDSGKTLFSCALLHAANQAGFSTAAIKPLAAGGIETTDGLRNDDALRLQAQCSVALDYAEVNPVCLPEALSPNIAAQRAGRRVQVERLAGLCFGVFSQRADLTVIEGAGGWKVPINDREFMSDLAKALQVPVILVVGMKLGCLNHAILSAEAIYRDGLKLAGWVANFSDPEMQAQQENVETLKEILPAPLIAQIPYLSNPDDMDQVIAHVNLEAISL